MANPGRTTYQTIIVGGGMSGLACAQRLTELGQDFLLISPMLGGRICTSKDGTVNFGAYFFGHLYRHVRPYVDLKRRFSLWSVVFHGAQPYTWTRSLRYPLQCFRLVWEIVRFRRAYRTYQQRSLQVGQKQAIEESAYLHTLYNQSAATSLAGWGFTGLTHDILGPAVRMCTLTPLEELSGFHAMHLLAQTLLPVWDFSFRPERMTQSFADRILFERVVKITNGNGYTLATSSGQTFHARAVVLATPIQISAKLLGKDFQRNPRNVYVYHVAGDIRPPWGTKPIHVFQKPSTLFVIIRQADGSFLLAAGSSDLDLGAYFSSYRVLEQKAWEPAFHFGRSLIDAKQGEHLYMVGDYNIVGLEDSFQTGLYAAQAVVNGGEHQQS